jgi:integrase/predicted RNA-binding Zn-ribbon protein involved in translation (DUF1610 family)
MSIGVPDRVVGGEQASRECPNCHSIRIWKDGLRGNIQRYLCRDCAYRFSQHNSFKECQTISNCQACGEGIDLAALESQKTGQWEATLLDYAWKLKKRGLAETTITARTYRLRNLAKKGADLNNPDSVETVLATESWTPINKHCFVMAYKSYTQTRGITWTPIKTSHESKQPFIPLESEIDQLIAGCGKKTSAFLQTLKETGARCGEAIKLKWTDLNSENNTLAINDPEKHSNSRTLKVSSKLVAMLNNLSTKTEYIFNSTPQVAQANYSRQRNRLAVTLQNPRLRQIHFHTLRHWKATMEYQRTRDILFVKHLLGHKRLENTEIYTHLIDFHSDEYAVQTAKTLDEETSLIENGFELVRYSQQDNLAIYRKRK